MEKIGFKIWNSDLAIGDEGNALVSSFLKKTSKLIETEINEDGRIAGNLKEWSGMTLKILAILSCLTSTDFRQINVDIWSNTFTNALLSST